MLVAYPMRNPREKREAYTKRHSSMKTERSSWDNHWIDLGKHLLPRSGRFFTSDRNRSDKSKYNSIYDNTCTRSIRVLGSGMLAGVSSPARPWFRLGTPDPDLSEFYPVRLWLDDVVVRMQQVFQKSNIYRTFHHGYEQLGVFGTNVFQLLPDFKKVVWCYPIPVGQFCLAQDYQGNVNTLYREFTKTVAETVREYGLKRCSQGVQESWRQRNFERAVHILQVIEPRDDQERNLDSNLSVDMPWASCHIELGGDDDKILRESGFNMFPVIAPRWQVDGDDVYGGSPGMDVLGDVRQLQHEQLRKGQAIDYQVKPPLQIPTSMKDRISDQYPGGQSYYDPGQMLPFDQTGPNSGIRSAFEVNIDLRYLTEDIQDVRMRCQKALYEDLFLMLANAGPNTRMTATEVAERHEEKLIMLGPVLERLHNEMLQPTIDLTFSAMMDAGLIPPPPPELDGMELSVEFISILAQAQRAIGSNAVDRFIGSVMEVSKVKPEVLDKVNFDRWVDRYSKQLGVDTDIVVDDDSVAALRRERGRAEAAQAQVMAMREQAATAKDLAASPTGPGEQNALTDVMTQLQGYSEPVGAGL